MTLTHTLLENAFFGRRIPHTGTLWSGVIDCPHSNDSILNFEFAQNVDFLLPFIDIFMFTALLNYLTACFHLLVAPLYTQTSYPGYPYAIQIIYHIMMQHVSFTFYLHIYGFILARAILLMHFPLLTKSKNRSLWRALHSTSIHFNFLFTGAHVEHWNLAHTFFCYYYSSIYISFTPQGYELVHNASKKILVTKESLALQQVSRHTSGRYQCLASNVEGDTLSNNLTISVMCKIGVYVSRLLAWAAPSRYIRKPGTFSFSLQISRTNSPIVSRTLQWAPDIRPFQ